MGFLFFANEDNRLVVIRLLTRNYTPVLIAPFRSEPNQPIRLIAAAVVGFYGPLLHYKTDMNSVFLL
jgi:hypothetical protein